MSRAYNLAIIGNGTTTVNALHALVEKYRASPEVIPPIHVTIFGGAPEQECGKGFAYGRIGGSVGHLTESPDHADYGSAKGEFRRYAATALNVPPESIHRVTRQLVGEFHAGMRYEQVKNEGRDAGIHIRYRESWVTDLARETNGQYSVASAKGSFSGFDRVVLAVGDVLSTQFDDATRTHPGKVFRTPYDAIETILNHSNAKTVVVARGTRSSFVDLVNPLLENGYEGKVVGVSPSGSTSWQTRENAAAYTPQFLTYGRRFDTVRDVISALRDELVTARQSGAYVPSELTQINPILTQRLAWDFDLEAEAMHANDLTYHHVSHAVKWEGIYENLRDADERRKFTATLGDFIIYNRVNIVVAQDYAQFIDGVQSGRVEIRRNSFDASDIEHSADRNRLTLRLGNGILDADYAVNCSIGPAPAEEQAQTHDLLRALSQPRKDGAVSWLTPRQGTGFDLAPGHAIDILGSQKRPYVFSGIGLETYGRQAQAWASDFVSELSARTGPTSSPQPATRKRSLENA